MEVVSEGRLSMFGTGSCRFMPKEGERVGNSEVDSDSVSLRRHGECNDRQWTCALIRSGWKGESRDWVGCLSEKLQGRQGR